MYSVVPIACSQPKCVSSRPERNQYQNYEVQILHYWTFPLLLLASSSCVLRFSRYALIWQCVNVSRNLECSLVGVYAIRPVAKLCYGVMTSFARTLTKILVISIVHCFSCNCQRLYVDKISLRTIAVSLVPRV